jgi:acyl-CoA synthetase (AMP-forming)/AMP-acid ligase II
LVQILRWRAAHQPDQRAYTFLADGETQEQHLSYRELDTKARAIGAALQALDAARQRALLVYPSGLDYICAFFGGLYASVINVPAYPPGHHAVQDRYLQRLHAIAQDARPRLVLSTARVRAGIKPLLPELPALQSLHWLATDDLPRDGGPEWRDLGTRGSELAFLQYTSGSTATPKGVMVSHGNLMHNAEMYKSGNGLSEKSIVVNWMPLFHDFGLIGHVLQALYLGVPCIFLEPAAFMQRPLRWLQAISRYRGTVSGAPNFAYELCMRKITEEQRRALDLSCWQVAFNAAEMVRGSTIDRFAQTFAPCGFRLEASTPIYGLAEATLIVSGGVGGYPQTTRYFKSAELARGRVVETVAEDADAKLTVGCGHSLLDQQIGPCLKTPTFGQGFGAGTAVPRTPRRVLGQDARVLGQRSTGPLAREGLT